jgi:E3 ubiquitin-protein ligase TRIP12
MENKINSKNNSDESDVELSDANLDSQIAHVGLLQSSSITISKNLGTSTSGGENMNQKNEEGEVVGEEKKEEEDDDEDDEDAILQRLTGNYRRFSETQRSRDRLDRLYGNPEQQDESNIQIHSRDLNHTLYSFEEDDDEIENHIHHKEEEEDDDMDVHEDVAFESHNDNDSNSNDSDHISFGDNFSQTNALQMLANVLGSANRSSGDLAQLENLFSNSIDGRADRTTINRDASYTDSTVNSLNQNSRSISSTSATNRSRPNVNRLIMNSFLDQLIPSQNSSRITSLLEGLNTHDNAYLIMETLNEISTTLLMMTSLQSERQVPTYALAESLVRVMNEYPEDLELQLVACRCIYNLAEVNFNLMYEITSADVIQCLNSKLLDLSYIDMAEQALQALEIISRKAGRQCLLKGSVPIVLAYLDFFTIHAQRKAMQVVANASKSIPRSKYNDIKAVFPTIKNVATLYTDPQCVESAWIVIANTIKSFQNSPSLLTALLDIDFLKKLCDIFPLCLSDGKKSSGLVTFKTCIFLLDSLSLLANSSSQFSNDLLTKCDIGLMIVKIFSSYESSKAKIGTSVSIDALLKCPKELLISLLKLVHSLIPLNKSTIKENLQLDVGNFVAINDLKNDINTEKINLSKSESDKLNDFYIQLFPLLLNIYDATVEYKIRRLVFIIVLRMVYLMSPEQLESIIHKSKITSILASTITHGKHIFDHKTSKYKDSEVVKFYSLLYGSLLVTHSLIKCNPKVFLNDFTKEGLISQINDLFGLFESEYKRIVDAENVSSERYNHSIHNVFDEDDDSDLDSYDDTELDYDDENENEDEEDDDANVADENENELAGRTSANSETVEAEESNGNFLGSIGDGNIHSVPIMDDGLKRLSKRSILDSLSSLSISIKQDYENLFVENQITKSENMNLLEIYISVLQTSAFNLPFESWTELWKEFAHALDHSSNQKAISSFELLSSGIVNELLEAFAKKDEENQESSATKAFKHVFCSSLSPCFNNDSSPLVSLIKNLEEALDRNESFEIVGSDSEITQNSRYRAESMTKQMKIKLVPLDSDANEEVKSVLLVVHAIATFETVQNFIQSSNSINLISNFNLNSSSLDREYHYDFYINDEKVPSDATIFGAVYKSWENDQNQVNFIKNNLLRTVHVVKYKVVPGKFALDDRLCLTDSNIDALVSIGNANVVSILLLLSSLYHINLEVSNPSTSDAVFLNYKLAAKLNRQLDEPLFVASGILPDWAVILPRKFPFLFPLETRLFFLKSTSFGYSRLIDYWLSRSKEEETGSLSLSNSVSRVPMLGRSIRHKLRISRDRIFPSAVKVMETYATNPGLIEIEFFDEVGSGLGPTLEFYSNVSKEFSKVKLYLWRSSSYSKLKENAEIYVKEKSGLFPRPIHKTDPHLTNILLSFKVLGKFLARSFLDSRLVDFHFNPLFFELSMQYASKTRSRMNLLDSINKIKEIDESLASSLKHLSLYLDKFAVSPEGMWDNVEVSDVTVSDLMLTFVLPGYEDVKLVPNGDQVAVTAINLESYINKIIDYTIDGGIIEQIKSFVEGFSEIFPFTSLLLFSAKELTRLSGNELENWKVETLISAIHADHGYTSNSPQLKWLIDIMSTFDKGQRRKFLKFITGSPRLPFDGFKGLSPPFTVVLKHTEGDLKPDDYLPSVMTCANYLKLPCYSSFEVMQSKIIQAMNEGNGAFLLS